jgi:antitoxin ParD1/3/4
MRTDLSPENEEFIEAAIATGDYKNRDEVVNEAISFLRKRQRSMAELREDVLAGINSGEAIAGERVFKRLENMARVIEQQANG